ncbi:MAG: 16S rRNA (uracil(1498)-N(3))-methyltransferase [Bacteroidales bacterium]|nr:16S rRNA (uracil(1498)-N(3))-methyltransferase [Bacteroidales bacterium]
MIVFYADRVRDGLCYLPADESAHCVRVLRHQEGDEISVIDGEGTLYTCVLEDADAKAATARIVREEPDWGAHPYVLTLAVCPTKNIDRYEWMAEKATEVGLDCLQPVIGDHSERRVFKPERMQRILLSASKQSLKGAIPKVADAMSVREFITGCTAQVRLIACCFEGETPRLSVAQAIAAALPVAKPEIAVLIGPEGDFSREEVELAVKAGFVPVHLGVSRLRTETAGLVAAVAVYLTLGTV